MQSDAPASKQFRILVIEDDANIARLILANLSKAGLECRYAADGVAGLAAFNETDPHLVLTDLMLPGLNGDGVIAKIREKSTVPVILMTAADSDEAQIQAFKAGADDYVSKPFNPKLMVARVVAHLRRVYRYDVTPEEEEKPGTPDARDLIPAGWVACDACGYLGPREKFEKSDTTGRRHIMCPNCKQGDTLTFSIG